jgi:hypothetical protein
VELPKAGREAADERWDPPVSFMCITTDSSRGRNNSGVFIYSFFYYFLEDKKLDDLKSEKLEAHFYELLAFRLIQFLDLSKTNPQK